jgi:hypothetical protein
MPDLSDHRFTIQDVRNREWQFFVQLAADSRLEPRCPDLDAVPLP